MENIKILPAYDHQNEIRELFSEYTEMLFEGDIRLKEYLAMQHYDEEVRNLEMKYGLPEGRLYIVYCGGEPAGCAGIRKVDEENCEMKRLYVRPKFRGQSIGRMLIEQLINDAGEIGYSHVVLDTLPFLKSAIRLYRSCGFHEIERYNDSPVDTSVYMGFDLDQISNR